VQACSPVNTDIFWNMVAKLTRVFRDWFRLFWRCRFCRFCCAATIGASTGTAFLGSTGFSFGFSFFGAKKWINGKVFKFILYAGLVSWFDKAQMCIRCEKEQKSKASTVACM